MSRLSDLVASATDPASGWDARLWRLWALFTAVAYTLILGVILVRRNEKRPPESRVGPLLNGFGAVGAVGRHERPGH